MKVKVNGEWKDHVAFLQKVKVDTLDEFIRDTMESYKIPNGVKTLQQYQFYNRSNLVNLDFNEVENIEQQCFRGCTKLINIVIPKIKTIGNMAFYGNYRAVLYDFGEDLQSVGSNSLTYLGGGCVVIFRGVNPPIFPTNNITNAITAIYVPDSAVDTYKGATNFESVANKIKPLSEYNP